MVRAYGSQRFLQMLADSFQKVVCLIFTPPLKTRRRGTALAVASVDQSCAGIVQDQFLPLANPNGKNDLNRTQHNADFVIFRD